MSAQFIKKNTSTIALVLLLIAFGLIARVLPHPANFAPITAIALFGGMYLPRRLTIALPVMAMLISDFFIGFYDLRIMASVYISFALAGLIARTIRKQKTFGKVALATLFSSLIFFFITNAAVWAFSDMYEQTLTGLIQSYTAALPFFKNSLLGDIFYTFLLVGAFEMAAYLYERYAKKQKSLRLA